MITKEHLKIFKSFNGDIDGWARMKNSHDPMTDDIWYEIEGLLQNLTIIKNGYSSVEFTTQTFQHMKSACDNSETQQELIDMSKLS